MPYDTLDAYYIGTLKLMVPLSAVANDTLDLYLTNAGASAGAPDSNGTNSQGATTAGSLHNIAYGADAGGAPDSFRFDATTAEIVGTASQVRYSRFLDAQIKVIPEPASLGLLGLAALMLRKRK
jgi:hypothetical protein